ncbi:hypothetical protein AK812_SmicGene40657 [Symbiodinium microadriaticum]|uniref:Uncharacterized protein n=2 Tax=Symbiodinium TaxID=2949 RepID=A0A1Q9C860_SYMMI|nr:hypothetical protein AK812_SmicGene40657 [Symbiodinium microadriaticum]
MAPSFTSMLLNFTRCYKPERLGLRANLTDVAMKLSAGILCMKKAVKYEAWMKRTNNKFHVLITDWREAKPCIHAVGESQQEDSWPEMVIILCDLPKSHENAVQWAGRQTTIKTPIRVVFEDPEQTHFQVIADLLQECYEKMLKRRPMLVPFNPGLLSQPEALTSRASAASPEPSGRIWEVASDVDSDEIRRAVRTGTIISLCEVQAMFEPAFFAITAAGDAHRRSRYAHMYLLYQSLFPRLIRLIQPRLNRLEQRILNDLHRFWAFGAEEATAMLSGAILRCWRMLAKYLAEGTDRRLCIPDLQASRHWDSDV